MPETDSSVTGLSLKRLVLIVLTALVGLVLVQSLLSSWAEPQVASQLQLRQTDLLLEGSAWKGEGLPDDQWPLVREGLLGKDPVAAAQRQYETVREEMTQIIAQAGPAAGLSADTDAGKPLSRRAVRSQQQAMLANLDLRLGLMEAYQGQVSAAVARWQGIPGSANVPASTSQTAESLIRLWQGQPVSDTDRDLLSQTLEGWFAYRALERFYGAQGDDLAQQQLLAAEQTTAQTQLLKLSLVGTLPVLGAAIGVVLGLGLLAQRFLKPDGALLRQHAGQGWAIPWDGEIIWQVLIVGFFFVGQILLPLVLGGLGLSSANLGGRGRALFSLMYYLLMAGGGLAVLWWSVRSYRPWPPDLFRIKPSWKAALWGIGGYFVALPLMLGVALINQQIWQGQGGSNPLLETVLKEQDPITLLIFFSTAAIAAPLFEEILFRGFLLPSLTRYMSVGWAIALSGFIFAAAHLSLSEVLPLMLLGCLLGFIYTRSRNLLSPIVLHSLWNSATMLGLFILGG